MTSTTECTCELHILYRLHLALRSEWLDSPRLIDRPANDVGPTVLYDITHDDLCPWELAKIVGIAEA